MDESYTNNRAELRGVLAAAPAFSHTSRGERFYVFPLETRRLSGTADTINVIARESLLRSAEVLEAGRLYVAGELRSFNNKVHWADPSAENTSAEHAVSCQHNGGAKQYGCRRQYAGSKPLKKGQRISKRNQIENCRSRKITRENRMSADCPIPARCSDEESEDKELRNATCKRKAHPDQLLSKRRSRRKVPHSFLL